MMNPTVKRLIDANELRSKAYSAMLEIANTPLPNEYSSKLALKMGEMFQKLIDEEQTIDAVEVVMCRDCAYWKPRHIKLNDGSERLYLPGEDYVSITVGINVGSQCMVDEYSGYGCDKSVFRRENDFCSRGIRKIDAEVEG